MADTIKLIETPISAIKYNSGDTVAHHLYGNCKVISDDGKTVTIIDKNGKKHLFERP